MIKVQSLIDRNNALRYMGFKGEPSEEIIKIAEERELELCSVMTPRYIYKVFDIDDDRGVLAGEDVARHLDGCGRYILFAATLGASVDNLIRKYQATDVTSALVVDAEASAAAEMLCDSATDEIANNVGGRLTSRFSPGYGDFPLEKQKGLLLALDAGRKIGLFAGDSYMLSPTKSVTAVIGIAKDGKCDDGFAHGKCRNCTFFDKCSVRKEW
ncbi:MAG: hypothetical protein IJS45_10465 [Clostridia bacterium]|nr:hypothetical protein [Clostridia bacterium]